MAREKLFVFAYDVSVDRRRDRVARLLQRHGVRVQRSVFEIHAAQDRAMDLARAAALHLAGDDSLRVYALTADGLGASCAFGPLPLPDPQQTHFVF